MPHKTVLQRRKHTYLNEVNLRLTISERADVWHLEFQKAFNTVSYRSLLDKSFQLRVSGAIIGRIRVPL